MTEARESKENQPEPKIVQLRQRFRFFKPEKTSILLELSSIAFQTPIDVNIESLGAFRRAMSYMFVPFDPDSGYRITQEDLLISTRSKKLDKAWQTWSDATDTKEELFTFSIESPWGLFLEEENRASVEKLRIQIFFPYGSYEAQPREDPLKKGGLSFHYFYPMDTGPLPKWDKMSANYLMGHIYPHKGHQILIPWDVEKLSKIEARFALTPNLQDTELNSA